MLPLHLDRDAWVLHWDEPVLLGFCAYLETLSPEQQRTLVDATRRLKVPLAELEAVAQRVARCSEPWPTLGGTAPRAAEFITSVRRVE